MKRDTVDEKIGRLLKKQLPPSAENKWFVQKVLNRLPNKQPKSYFWVAAMVNIMCMVVCLIGWVLFIFSLSPNVILVKDVVVGTILFVVTVALFWRWIADLLMYSET